MLTVDEDFVTYVERYLLARDVSDEYAGQLRARVRKFQQWRGSPIIPRELSDELVNGFLKSLEGQVEPETIRGYRCNIIALWNGAYDDRLTDSRPGRIRMPKIPEKVIEAYDLAELGKLIEAAGKLRGHFRFGPRRAEWFVAFVLTKYKTTLRLGDVLKLKWSDVADDGSITLAQNKTGRLHTVVLGIRELTAIRAIGWKGQELLPWLARQDAFYGHYRELRALAGLSGSSKWLRRSGASYAELDQPGNGARMLGHRSANLFTRHYECRRITQPKIVTPREIPTQHE